MASDLRSGFEAFYCIPKGATAIWISLHNRPATNRVIVRGVEGHDIVVRTKTLVFGLTWQLKVLQKMLRKDKGRPIYAELEYEIAV